MAAGRGRPRSQRHNSVTQKAKNPRLNFSDVSVISMLVFSFASFSSDVFAAKSSKSSATRTKNVHRGISTSKLGRPDPDPDQRVKAASHVDSKATFANRAGPVPNGAARKIALTEPRDVRYW